MGQTGQLSSVVLMFLSLVATLTRGLEVRSCSNGAPRPAIVSISGCSAMPCDFPRGVNTTVTMVYEAPFDVQSLRYDRFLRALGIISPSPLPPERENGCNWIIGGSCPIRQGELVISTHVSNPLSIYPLVSVTIVFSIYDEQDRLLTCFEYDINITQVNYIV